MKTGISVADGMTTKPITVSPEITIQEAAMIMVEKHVGALLIKDKEQFVGIMTERDMLKKLIALGKHPQKTIVADVMNPRVHTIEPHIDIFDALQQMRELNIRHLPVVAGKKMVGLLTIKDILKIQPQLFDLLVDRIELREEERKPIWNIGEREGLCQSCGEYASVLHSREGTLVCNECRS